VEFDKVVGEKTYPTPTIFAAATAQLSKKMKARTKAREEAFVKSWFWCRACYKSKHASCTATKCMQYMFGELACVGVEGIKCPPMIVDESKSA
jgi:hypothetical protein